MDEPTLTWEQEYIAELFASFAADGEDVSAEIYAALAFEFPDVLKEAVRRAREDA
jgi:hypothetical protein